MKSHGFRLVWGAACSATLILATVCASAQPSAAPPSREGLVAAVRAAKAQFQPLVKADLDQARAELAAAVARLEGRLQADPINGPDWRQYLQGDKVAAGLGAPGELDLGLVGGFYRRLAAGYEGLELAAFGEARRAARQYLVVAGSLSDPKFKAKYEQTLDDLAKRLEPYLAGPTADEAFHIGQVLDRLEIARQAPGVIQAVRLHFTYPNLFVRIGGPLVGAGIAGPVDEVTPIRDVILGTDIHGTGRTVGQTSVTLPADAEFALFDVVLYATTRSQNVGYNGPVTLQSCGTTSIGAAKRFWFDAGGLSSLPAVSSAVTQTNITDIQAKRRIAERIGWRRAGKQKSEAECIASQHAQQRANRRMDDQAADMLGRTNSNYQKKVYRPLTERKVFPQKLAFSTADNALHINSVEAAANQLAAPTAPPPLRQPSDLAVQVHESSINNMANTLLSGMLLREETLQATLTDLLGQVPPELKPGQEDKEPWQVRFAQEQPISVAFGGDRFTVVIRGDRWYTGDKPHPGMNVTAVYRIVKTDQGFKAVREDLQAFPPGFDPTGKKRLGVREQTIRNLLQRRFGKILAPELVSKGIALPGKWASAGKLQPVEFTTKAGWLVVGWRLPAK